MTLLIDPPNAAGHGRMWSHLASDESLAELHDFARRAGIPERGFDRDHYDVPADYYDRMVAAGAVPVTSRELITRLIEAGLRRRKSTSPGRRRPGHRLVEPPALVPGDRVAVVTPSGTADPVRLAAGEAVLRGWGLDVVSAPQLPAAEVPWLAGADAARAASLQEVWTDPRVAAVWCGRGGFGSQRVLDLLDWPSLAGAAPKWLVGFSDVTALHQAFATRLGLVTVHGAGVAGLADADPMTVGSVRTLLFGGERNALSGAAGGGGTASGVLVGGTLTLLAALLGSPDSRPARDSIALLEDVGEAPYRLDRMLTQLLRAGWFDGVRGVACGSFTSCGDGEQVRSLLRARLEPLGVPLVYDLPVGHGAVNHALALGRTHHLDGERGTLT